MTVRQEAYRLIDSLPDASVSFLVQIIRNMSPEFYNGTVVMEPFVLNNETRTKLNQISSLPDNWNGNGAARFNKEHIELVDRIISGLEYVPEVFPTGCDTIQIEFERSDGGHLEIEIPEKGCSEYYFVDPLGNSKIDKVETSAIEINRLVRSFYESKI